MSQENVDKVRTSFEAYCGGDYAGGSEWLSPDVTWENGQELPARGPAAVREMWKRWDNEWEELGVDLEQSVRHLDPTGPTAAPVADGHDDVVPGVDELLGERLTAVGVADAAGER